MCWFLLILGSCTRRDRGLLARHPDARGLQRVGKHDAATAAIVVVNLDGGDLQRHGVLPRHAAAGRLPLAIILAYILHVKDKVVKEK